MPAPRRPLAEHHVLGDRQVGCRRELLEDHPDAAPARGGRVERAVALARDLDRPGVGLVVAGEDLDEGGLARAVLAEQREHFAAGGVEVDSAEHLDATERLPDLTCVQSEEIRHGYRTSSGGSGSTC